MTVSKRHVPSCPDLRDGSSTCGYYSLHISLIMRRQKLHCTGSFRCFSPLFCAFFPDHLPNEALLVIFGLSTSSIISTPSFCRFGGVGGGALQAQAQAQAKAQQQQGALRRESGSGSGSMSFSPGVDGADGSRTQRSTVGGDTGSVHSEVRVACTGVGGAGRGGLFYCGYVDIDCYVESKNRVTES